MSEGLKLLKGAQASLHKTQRDLSKLLEYLYRQGLREVANRLPYSLYQLSDIDSQMGEAEHLLKPGAKKR